MRTVIIVLLVAVLVFVAATVIFRADDQQKKLIAERDRLIAGHELTTQGLQAELARDKASYAAQVAKIVTLENRIKDLLKPAPQPVGNPDQLPQIEPSRDHVQLPPLKGLNFADAFDEYIRRNVQAREDHKKIVTDYEDLLSIKDGVIRDLYRTTNKLAGLGKRRICLTIGPCVYVGSSGVGFGVSLQLGYRIW